MFKIGIMGNPLRSLLKENMVYGYDIAANELLESIIKYADIGGLDFFCEPEQFQEQLFRRKLKRIMRDEKVKKNIIIRNEYDILFQKNSKLDVDILHNVSHDFRTLVALRERMHKNIPVTFTIHCASYPQLLEDFFLPMVMMPLKSYDTLICTSNAVKKSVKNIIGLVENYCEKKAELSTEVIPLGIDTSHFRPLEKVSLRKKYNIEKNAFVILWLGRFSACDKADLYPLLIVTKRLIEKNPDKNIKLVMSGYEPDTLPYITYLKRQIEILDIQSHVVIINKHDVKTRNELYALSNVFTSPIDNLQETFGITPIEAMACGIPQVVADWNGYRDTVIEGETGFRVTTKWCQCDEDLANYGMLPVDIKHRSFIHQYVLGQSVAIDLEEFEKKLGLLLNNEKIYRKMCEKSRERAVNNYDWRKIIEKYDELWSELVIQSKEHKKLNPKNNTRLLLPDYYNCFKNYATREIDLNEKLCINDRNLPNARISEVYDIDNMIFDRNLEQKIYEKFNEGQYSIREIINTFEEYPAPFVKRTIMRCLKYGILIENGK